MQEIFADFDGIGQIMQEWCKSHHVLGHDIQEYVLGEMVFVMVYKEYSQSDVVHCMGIQEYDVSSIAFVLEYMEYHLVVKNIIKSHKEKAGLEQVFVGFYKRRADLLVFLVKNGYAVA